MVAQNPQPYCSRVIPILRDIPKLFILTLRYISRFFQAGNAIRTRDIHLGKVTLYH